MESILNFARKTITRLLLHRIKLHVVTCNRFFEWEHLSKMSRDSRVSVLVVDFRVCPIHSFLHASVNTYTSISKV